MPPDAPGTPSAVPRTLQADFRDPSANPGILPEPPNAPGDLPGSTPRGHSKARFLLRNPKTIRAASRRRGQVPL